MKLTSLKIIVILMSISVIGLIAIQFYWISKALELEEDKFNRSVSKALSETAKFLEKDEAANILVKEISTHNENHIVYTANDSLPAKKNIKKRELIKYNSDSVNSDVDILYLSNGDTSDSNIQITNNVRVFGDSTIKETIIWHKEVDSLVQIKTRIIENVFEELILTEKKDNPLLRLNRVTIDSILSESFISNGINLDFDFAVQVSGKDSLLFIEKNSSNNLKNTIHKAKLFPNNIFSKAQYLLVDFNNKSKIFIFSIWSVLLISFIFTSLIIYLFYKTVSLLIKQKKITELKNDLLNNITHEFKTPISTIVLAADIIGEKKNDNFNKYTNIIRNESKRLTSMVENILSTAALENGENILNKERLNIHELIDKVLAKHELPLSAKNGEIKRHYLAAKPNLSVDKIHFSNAISNIVDNAIKYCSSNPIINITTIDSNNAFEINIQDNGIGIDSNNHSKIFDTFYRVPTGNLHNVKGNGIGLSFVKKIIKMHEGTISIQSELKKGSTFIINIPKF